MHTLNQRIRLNAATWILLLCLLVSPSVTEPDTIPEGYSVETIDIPDEITLEVGGLAFAPNDTLYVTTRYGEVWLYRDGNWKKFAEGLQNAQGIELADGGRRAFVVQKPELTELIDTDGDREAEDFNTVSSDWGVSGDYHEYAYGPVRDRDGHFYVALNLSAKPDTGRVRGSVMGRGARKRGTVVRVSRDGSTNIFAYGFRSPAGIAMSPDDELFVTDNQGDWVPTSPLLHVEKGKFYGHPASLADHPAFEDRPLNEVPVSEFRKKRTYPVLWMPYDLAKSPGSPVFDTKKHQFGPFDGQMFIGDQNEANLMRVSVEKVRGTYQGVVFNFIDQLQCGIVRATFGPDHNLWVGQTDRGWKSKGSVPYGLQRIAYDGETVPYSIRTIKLRKGGFSAHFTKPVNRKAANNPDNYNLSHWTYKYHSDYGSEQIDKQQVNVQSVDVSPDGRSVEINLPKLKTRRVYKIKITVPAADDSKLANNIGWYTVNKKK